MVIPSRLDNLPNIGVEAHACATPVVAFHTGGLPDIVDHQRTGYLAKAFDTEDLAHGIAWVLAQRATGLSGGVFGPASARAGRGAVCRPHGRGAVWGCVSTDCFFSPAVIINGSC